MIHPYEKSANPKITNEVMKKIFITMIALALTIATHGQEVIDTAQFVAMYDYECRTQNDEGQNVTDKVQVVVQVGRTVTKSMPRTAYKLTDKSSGVDVLAANQEAMMHIPTVWMGWPHGQTTVREYIFPHEFEGSEPTLDIEWTLLDDTVTINGYHCQQATAKFKDIEWRVCYTEEIPSSAGPWRLRGLPGLIVQAESKAHTFSLAELRQEMTPITAPEQKPDVQRMAYAKLLKYRNKIFGNRQYPKNPIYYVSDISGGTLSLGGSISHMEVFNMQGQQVVFANGHPLLTKAHVYQPLEMK